MPLDQLWATWRSNYVTGLGSPAEAEFELGEGSLFERILGAPGSDADKHLVLRGRHCFVLLDKFPYTVGHLLVLPNRAEAALEGLDSDEHTELWELVTAAVVALERAFACDGVNVGLNLGSAAGGSQKDHLHVHCVPRWIGDANFMSTVGEVRVLPVPLDEAWRRLVEVWPHQS